MPPKKYPRIIDIPPQKMAVVTTVGDPNDVFSRVLPALYGSVYTHKFDLKKQGKETFKVGKLFARWPDAHIKPKNQWTAVLGVPIPDNTTELPQKVPEVQVKIDTWQYGVTAEIMHKGPYSEEGPTVEALHKFIEEQGYEIAGTHEEEYLTMPDAKIPKTIIRYPVKKKS
jgi:hypothetical protein